MNVSTHFERHEIKMGKRKDSDYLYLSGIKNNTEVIIFFPLLFFVFFCQSIINNMRFSGILTIELILMASKLV